MSLRAATFTAAPSGAEMMGTPVPRAWPAAGALGYERTPVTGLYASDKGRYRHCGYRNFRVTYTRPGMGR